MKSGIQNNGLESYLTLNPLEENIGTYTCRVKNSAGADISCEIEVQKKKGTHILIINYLHLLLNFENEAYRVYFETATNLRVCIDWKIQFV